MSISNNGTPIKKDHGVVIYEVHKLPRKTFSVSFQHENFDGWAEDGRTVSGYIRFPNRDEPIPFTRKFTSGRELVFDNMSEVISAHNKCEKGQEIEFSFEGNLDLTTTTEYSSHEEGSAYYRHHIDYERFSNLARAVREESLGFCIICETNYRDTLGDIGINVIEAHHLNPLSSGGTRISRKKDLIALCANCHRWTHAWMRKNLISSADANTIKLNYNKYRCKN